MVVKQIPLRIRKYANSPGPSAFTPADIILDSLDSGNIFQSFSVPWSDAVISSRINRY